MVRVHDQCGPNARAAANHMSLTAAEGHLFIESISGRSNDNATITARIHGTSADGSTAPIVTAYNAALPTGAVDEQFVIGIPQVAGTRLLEVTSVTVDYNPDFDPKTYAGRIWPQLIDIRKVSALITIETDDPTILGTGAGQFPITGAKAEHTNSYLQFIQREPDAAFYAPAALRHIRCTFAGLVHVSQPYSASGNDTGITRIEIATIDSDTQRPIVWAIDQAYVA